MKHYLIVFLILLLNTTIFSQEENKLSLLVDGSSAGFFRGSSLAGAGSFEVLQYGSLGIMYHRQINEKWWVGIGMIQSEGDVLITSAPVPEVVEFEESIHVFSIPITANYFFNKRFFANAGLLFDYQKEDFSYDSQQGVGFILGTGVQFSLKRIKIIINPNFKMHAAIPLQEENYHQRLTEISLRFGLGYAF